jgi:hypothetical protein
MGFGLFCRQLMKKVFPGIGYGKMQLSYLGFGLLRSFARTSLSATWTADTGEAGSRAF